MVTVTTDIFRIYHFDSLVLATYRQHLCDTLMTIHISDRDTIMCSILPTVMSATRVVLVIPRYVKRKVDGTKVVYYTIP